LRSRRELAREVVNMNTAMRELIAGELVKISLSIEIDNCVFVIYASVADFP